MDSVEQRVPISQCCTESINIFSNFLLSIGAIGALAISIIAVVNVQILPYSRGVRIFLKILAITMSVIHSLLILLFLICCVKDLSFCCAGLISGKGSLSVQREDFLYEISEESS